MQHAILRLLALVVASLLIGGAAPVQAQGSFAHGAVVALQGTPHLWFADEQGLLHWGGDTRALAGKHIDWGNRVEVSLDQLRTLPVGDPWLSAGLLKDGDPIYLVKWETEWPLPQLLHIQTIGDVELFGINGSNYGNFVMGAPAWEARYGISVAGLQRGTLATTIAPVTISYIKELKIGDDVSPRIERGIRRAFQLMHQYALSLGLRESEITRDLRIYAWNQNVDAFIAPYRQRYVRRSAAEARKELKRERGAWSSGGRYIFIPTSHREAYTTARLMKTPAHELVHVFSSNLSALSKGGPDHLVPPAGPEWINEGGADYLAYRAISWGGVQPYWVTRQHVRHDALRVRPEGGLAALGSEDGLDRYRNSYDYAMLAVELLVSERGDASYLEYYRSLQPGTTWPAQFQKAFGISVEDFYAKFAAHAAARFPLLAGMGATCPESPDRAALVALYNATDGPNWRDNANWLSDAPVCGWHGVFIDASGRVTHLDLVNDGLSGPLPAELGSLANLVKLDLAHNRLSGEIPAELGNLANLEELGLAGNQLTGCIPRGLLSVNDHDLNELGLDVCAASS
ncbi:MAG: hypothetical protein OXU67_02910 [Chloroflexota bacterium]|nr:hypothetical protein [Chloroflexota bacterium]